MRACNQGVEQLTRAIESYLGRFLVGVAVVMLLVVLYVSTSERPGGFGPADWLALSAVLTAVLAGATLVVVLHHLHEVRRLRWEQARPYVVGTLELDPTEPQAVHLVLRNTGRTVADSLELEVRPPPTRRHDGEPLVYPTSLPSLAPGQVWRTFWDFGAPAVPHVLRVGYVDPRRVRHSSVSPLN